MKCAACKKTCRKTHHAWVALSETRGVVRARVCGRCFDSAIHIVPSVVSVAKAVAPVEAERKAARDALGPAIKRLEGIVKAHERSSGRGDPEVDAEIAGVERAISVLMSGEFS